MSHCTFFYPFLPQTRTRVCNQWTVWSVECAGAGWMRRNGIGSTFWGSFHQLLCVWAAPGPGWAAGHKPEINLKPDICVWAELQLSHCCHQQLCDKCETQQRFSIFLHLKEMGNSEKCISTKLTLFSFHDLFSKQRIRNFCCADLNKSTIWRRAKWFCETLRLPKMWWDGCGWARISPIFLPTNNPDVATSVLMVSWRPGGSRQPTVWFVCLWFVELLG